MSKWFNFDYKIIKCFTLTFAKPSSYLKVMKSELDIEIFQLHQNEYIITSKCVIFFFLILNYTENDT